MLASEVVRKQEKIKSKKVERKKYNENEVVKVGASHVYLKILLRVCAWILIAKLIIGIRETFSQ